MQLEQYKFGWYFKVKRRFWEYLESCTKNSILAAAHADYMEFSLRSIILFSFAVEAYPVQASYI